MKIVIKKLKNKAFSYFRIKKDFVNRKKILAQYPPDEARPAVKISSNMEKYQDDLINNGVVKIPGMFVELSDLFWSELQLQRSYTRRLIEGRLSTQSVCTRVVNETNCLSFLLKLEC